MIFRAEFSQEDQEDQEGRRRFFGFGSSSSVFLPDLPDLPVKILLLLPELSCGREARMRSRLLRRSALVVGSALLFACGGGGGADPNTDPALGPAAGNASGGCTVPGEAQLADVSSPRTVIGDGTPESCTSDAVVAAVAGGGVITFDCGPDP